MQRKFQNSYNPSVFITTPIAGRTGLNPAAENHAVMTQKLWVLNKQWQAFVQVVWLGQNRVPHTWLRYPGPSGYDNCPSDFHQQSGVAQIRVLHSLMSQTNITTLWINPILESHVRYMK
jgi:hypothetical protein